MNRKQLINGQSKQEVVKFFSQYHYKTELAALCRAHHLPAIGTKAELNARLRGAMLGTASNMAPTPTPTASRGRAQALTAFEITLDTPIAGSGFRFNAAAREFFAAYFHIRRFAYTKPMAIVKRQALADPSQRLTVRDLVTVYQQTQEPAAKKAFLANNAEEGTYEWNHFVRDFCADPATAQYQSKLKAAALLWRQVRQGHGEKRYRHALLADYSTLLRQYQPHQK
ncbi:SAP domain-containing protein [Schleiferilactobacillus shenzhenensis]|uniref:SAP domain-containing protein n=1 Tax=Schleiferilactobacillus shenzhenensis LY-73 TaxID=1231336 RepID=U4TVS9_9LACO|nr:SAP domain-containing protein [Schleiferilactobacillus shenzhenensis]ERL65948.1 hypothetical protein L248_2024 [Schleiferilactobacillus shenzhenensis LY-73]